MTTDRHVWTDERIDDMVDRVDKNIDLLRAEMRLGFAAVDARFTAIDHRFTAMDERFVALDARMADGFTSLRRDMLHGVLGLASIFVAAIVTILVNTL
jgi:hypothetical protein